MVGRVVVNKRLTFRPRAGANAMTLTAMRPGQQGTVSAARSQLAGQHCHQLIVAQLVVVVEILVPERDPEHSLPQQGHDLMLNQMLAPCVMKAFGKPLRQPDRMIRRPKKQRSRIRGDRPAVERRHHLAAFNRCKSEQIRALHSVGIGVLLESSESRSRKTTFADSAPRCVY
jgi:hypothetical protein